MILNVLFFIIKMVLMLFAEFVCFFGGLGGKGKGKDMPIREGGLMVLAILIGLEWMLSPLL